MTAYSLQKQQNGRYVYSKLKALLNFSYFLRHFFLSDVLFNMEIATYRELCRLFSRYLKRS